MRSTSLDPVLPASVDVGGADAVSVIPVGCVKAKRERPSAARDLYESALFKRRRWYAERRGVPWFVLSAEFGLVARMSGSARTTWNSDGRRWSTAPPGRSGPLHAWSDESGRSTVRQVDERLRRFRLIGQKKAAVAVEILLGKYRKPLAGISGTDVAYDVHVRRVFLRAGIVEHDEVEAVVNAARRLFPAEPGRLDLPPRDQGTHGAGQHNHGSDIPSPAACSRPAASDPNYTLDRDGPLKRGLDTAIGRFGGHPGFRRVWSVTALAGTDALAGSPSRSLVGRGE